MKDRRALFQALNTVRYVEDFAPIRQWLEEERQASRDKLETLQGDHVMVEQGRAQTFRMILSMIEDSPRLLEKASRQGS